MEVSKKIPLPNTGAREDRGRRQPIVQSAEGTTKVGEESTAEKGNDIALFSPKEHSAMLINAPSVEKQAELVLRLQQTYGNAYVQRLLDSRTIQAKLTVSNPGDPFETEAERVSEAVMHKLDLQSQIGDNQSIITGRIERQAEEEEEVQTQRQPEEEEEVQMQRHPISTRAESENISPAEIDLEQRINMARGSGSPMDATVRKPMEQAFNADFSGTRIHTDAVADELSRNLQAQAFTTKQDIFFKAGNYQPESGNGRRLLAHELTHVVQQSGRVPDIERAGEAKGVALPVIPRQSSEVPDLTELTVTRVKMKIQAGKKQEAIDLILEEVKAAKFSKLDQLVGQTIKYDKDEPDIGGLYYNYDPQTNKASNIGISIGDAAFSSVAWLYSTMGHEHQHAIQMVTDPKKWDAKEPLSEFVAWSWEILHAGETGVRNIPAKMKELGEGLKSEAWDQMSTLERMLNVITYNRALSIVKTATTAKK
jgi:hypothetical protein